MMLRKEINYRFVLTCLLVLVVFNFLPLILLAEEPTGLVPPSATGNYEGGPSDYGWEELVSMFNGVVDFIFLDLMIPLAVIAIVWAGIQVLRGKTQPGELIKAKGALSNVAIGIFIALGAYVIIKSILSLLVKSGGILDSSGTVINQVFR